jgi:hypothetical protein
MTYSTRFSIHLKPHGTVAPQVQCGINEPDSDLLVLKDDTQVTYDIELPVGHHRFVLCFANKTNATPDMAVEIVSVTVEDITVDRFKWAGVYYPDYPEPWASEQTAPLLSALPSSTYLGWNGQWELEFSVPVFRWIHTTEHLGWIYD